MNAPEAASYFVEDPRPIAARARYTFFLPNDAELTAVGPNDLVKLMFEYPHATEKWGGERMWVRVISAEGDQLNGELANEPDEVTSPLVLGAPVDFQRHQILAI